mmetsp:Transcript_15263/g.33528  ORF Transcript_15263/g.33528 Transcript_15263/m.33528 type:complete len:228 (+) Transcript_15263:166-849(+)
MGNFAGGSGTGSEAAGAAAMCSVCSVTRALAPGHVVSSKGTIISELACQAGAAASMFLPHSASKGTTISALAFQVEVAAGRCLPPSASKGTIISALAFQAEVAAGGFLSQSASTSKALLCTCVAASQAPTADVASPCLSFVARSGASSDDVPLFKCSSSSGEQRSEAMCAVSSASPSLVAGTASLSISLLRDMLAKGGLPCTVGCEGGCPGNVTGGEGCDSMSSCWS